MAALPDKAIAKFGEKPFKHFKYYINSGAINFLKKKLYSGASPQYMKFLKIATVYSL